MPNPAIREPLGRPYVETREYGVWVVLGVFAVGALLGTAAALLYAPESGARTRKGLVRRVQKLTGREKNSWRLLRRALRKAAQVEKPETAKLPATS